MKKSDITKIIKEEIHKLIEGVGADIYVDHNYKDGIEIEAGGDLDYDWSKNYQVSGMEKLLKREQELNKALKKSKKNSDEEEKILDEIDEIGDKIKDFTEAVDKEIKPLYYKLAMAWEKGTSNIVSKLEKRYLK